MYENNLPFTTAIGIEIGIIGIQKEIKMKKTSGNFNKLFQKIHKDNMLRSPFYNQLSKSILMLPTSKQTSFNANIIKSNVKQMYDKNLTNRDKRPKTARPGFSKANISLEKQLLSEGYKILMQHLATIQKQFKSSIKNQNCLDLPLISQQLKRLLALCTQIKQYPYESSQILAEFSQNLSRIITHRRIRIVFLFLYSKYLQCNSTSINITKQLKLLRECQILSRQLTNFWMALYVCSRIQKILLIMKRYDESLEQARKVLRLAVFLKDRLEEFKAIEQLKMIGCYYGRINKCSDCYLQKEDREAILKNYHPTHDIPVEQNAQNVIKRVYSVQRLQSEDDANITSNIEKFVSNMTLMRKDLTQRSKCIMSTIKKVNSIGSVNKYLQTGTCITLQPRSRNLPARNRGQILLTHSRKKSYNQSNHRFYKLYLPGIMEMIKNVINFVGNLST